MIAVNQDKRCQINVVVTVNICRPKLKLLFCDNHQTTNIVSISRQLTQIKYQIVPL